MTATDITEEEKAWLSSYARDVANKFSAEFDAASDRFKDGKKLLDRFSSALDIMLSKGRTFISGVDEAHNELCIASQLLANSNPRFTLLEYEPSIEGNKKTIDFRATHSAQAVYVDVKTIKPQSKDRWEQFQRAIHEDWFPEHVRVTLSKEWLGGELWHNMFAARCGFRAKAKRIPG